jgi:hypothetical protein
MVQVLQILDFLTQYMTVPFVLVFAQPSYRQHVVDFIIINEHIHLFLTIEVGIHMYRYPFQNIMIIYRFYSASSHSFFLFSYHQQLLLIISVYSSWSTCELPHSYDGAVLLYPLLWISTALLRVDWICERPYSAKLRWKYGWALSINLATLRKN